MRILWSSLLALLLFANPVFAMQKGHRVSLYHPRYSGSHHTESHGGHYSGGHESPHKGGHYVNPKTGNHYGRHR